MRMSDTAEGDRDDFVKLYARLDADICGLGGESFWAVPTEPGSDLYRVDNLLFAAPFGIGDTVRAVPNEDDRLQVVAVTARAPRTTVLTLIELAGQDDDGEPDLAGEALVSQARANFVRELTERDARIEGGMGTALVVQCPDTLTDPDAVEQWLDDAITAALETLADDPAFADADMNMLNLNWMPISSPTDPVGVPPGLITDLTLSPEEKAFRPEPAPDWDAGHDLGLVAAIETVFKAGDMPEWLDPDEFTARAILAWRGDTRVRHAVATGNYADIVTLVIRGAAIDRGLQLPPLERALFTFD